MRFGKIGVSVALSALSMAGAAKADEASDAYALKSGYQQLQATLSQLLSQGGSFESDTQGAEFSDQGLEEFDPTVNSLLLTSSQQLNNGQVHAFNFANFFIPGTPPVPPALIGAEKAQACMGIALSRSSVAAAKLNATFQPGVIWQGSNPLFQSFITQSDAIQVQANCGF